MTKAKYKIAMDNGRVILPYLSGKLSDDNEKLFLVHIEYEDGDLTMMFLTYTELSELANFDLVKEYVDKLMID